ncbi:DUF5605 domain-containing protein [Nonomuraea angiospora]|uniref:DUF5605 domain-containing protein n=1 Tax=Nonomuraea angiospora TaxID=46172 RepID=UPI00344F1009
MAGAPASCGSCSAQIVRSGRAGGPIGQRVRKRQPDGGLFDALAPAHRDVTMEPGTVWRVDVIDTWNMTVDTLPGTYSGSFRVPLPARQYMAIRCVAADAGQIAGPP